MALQYNPSNLALYYSLNTANLLIYSVTATALLIKVKDSLDYSPYFTIFSFWIVYASKFAEYTYFLIVKPEVGDIVYSTIYVLGSMTWCLTVLILFYFVFEMESLLVMLLSETVQEY